MAPHQPVTKMWLIVGQIVLQIEALEFEEILEMTQEAILQMERIETQPRMHIQYGPVHSLDGKISMN